MTSFSGGIRPGIRCAYVYRAAAGRVDDGRSGNDRPKALIVIPIAA
ncbi:hypothetical protein [Sphingomonas sp. RB1R13]